MLTYCSTGERNYYLKPVNICTRHYWEYQIFLTGDSCPIFNDSPKHHIPAGNFWLFHPDCPHGWKAPINSSCEVAVFHFTEVPELLRQFFHNHSEMVIELSSKDCEIIRELARKIGPEVIHPDIMSTLRYRICRDRLSLLFLEKINQIETIVDFSNEKQIVHAAEGWFCSHMDEGICVEETASKMGYSVSHLRRIFQKVKGVPPKTVFTEYRMHRATELLHLGNIPIVEIAIECGYSAHSTFTRAFKKFYGIPPSYYLRHLII